MNEKGKKRNEQLEEVFWVVVSFGVLFGVPVGLKVISDYVGWWWVSFGIILLCVGVLIYAWVEKKGTDYGYRAGKQVRHPEGQRSSTRNERKTADTRRERRETPRPAPETREAVPSGTREFLEGIIRDAGYTSLMPTSRRKLVIDLAERLDTFLFGKFIDFLPSDERTLKAFEVMLERGDMDRAKAFLAENIQDFGEVLEKGMIEFRRNYLEKARRR